MAVSQGGFSAFPAGEKGRGGAGWDPFKALSVAPTPVVGAAGPGWRQWEPSRDGHGLLPFLGPAAAGAPGSWGCCQGQAEGCGAQQGDFSVMVLNLKHLPRPCLLQSRRFLGSPESGTWFLPPLKYFPAEETTEQKDSRSEKCTMAVLLPPKSLV